MRSITISSGHGLHTPGAIGLINEVSEARRVVPRVAQFLRQAGVAVNEFHDNTSRNQRDNLNTIVRHHNNTVRDMDISIHFNAASATDGPRGTEVWHLNNNTRTEAARVSRAISKASGLRDRGARANAGFMFLNSTNRPALLVEVCFVDSQEDVRLYRGNFERICRGIAEGILGRTISGGSVPAAPKPPATAPAPSTPPPSGQTFIQWMQANGMDSSFANRARLAAQHGIVNYTGTAAQNLRLWDILRASRSGSTAATPTATPATRFFPANAARDGSIVNALNAIRVDSSMTNRQRIARANGIANYTGTAAQNTQLLNLLRQGRLVRP